MTSKDIPPGENICMVVDLDRCWGCRACEVACKQELEIGAGPRPMLIEEIGPRKIDGKLHKDFVPVMCQHCHEPACLEACPTEAIFRAQDLSVQINSDLCIQCGECTSACPFGVIDYSEAYGPVKCNFCFSRRESGWLPSCAQHCEGRAFTVAVEKEISAIVDGKKYSWSTGRIIYVSDKWASLGQSFRADPL